MVIFPGLPSPVIQVPFALLAVPTGAITAAVPHANDVFAIALESNDNTDVKIIEAIVL